MNMQRKDKGAKRIYFCEQHKAWHITSQDRREVRNKRKEDTPVNSSKKRREE